MGRARPTLDYLIGFTDAEGSIERRKNTVRVSWSQKESNAGVLALIQELLSEHNIPSSLTVGKRYHGRYEDLHVLRTTWVGGRCLMEMIGDMLIVKGSNELASINDKWAYLAGFFDGDGHISDTMQRGYRTIRLVFTQKDDNILLDIMLFMEGQGVPVIISNPKENGCINLGISQRHSLPVLKSLLPHLIVRYLHAEEAAEYLTKVVVLKEEHGYWYRRDMERGGSNRT